jgi:hypothetical protein
MDLLLFLTYNKNFKVLIYLANKFLNVYEKTYGE